MPHSDTKHGDCEIPVFGVGAAGFDPQQRAFIESCLHRTPRSTIWRLCPIGDADAWLVNGAKCRLIANGSLRVASGAPGEASLNLDIGATSRPVAFAMPIVEAAIEPHLTFDVNSSASLQALLAELDSCLRFARGQFILGVEVVRRGAALRHGVFYVSHRDKLLAILDFWRGEVALAASLDAAELEDAQWVKQPTTVDWELPRGFVHSTPAQLAWIYARRSELNLLPPRYRQRPIYYRHTPRVPLSWLRDSHLKILKELSTSSASFAELAERTGLPRLERDVACLFFARAITTSKSKAAPAAAALEYARRPILDEPGAAFLRETALDPTVPGQLARRA